jgi:hypothetical protein
LRSFTTYRCDGTHVPRCEDCASIHAYKAPNRRRRRISLDGDGVVILHKAASIRATGRYDVTEEMGLKEVLRSEIKKAQCVANKVERARARARVCVCVCVCVCVWCPLEFDRFVCYTAHTNLSHLQWLPAASGDLTGGPRRVCDTVLYTSPSADAMAKGEDAKKERRRLRLNPVRSGTSHAPARRPNLVELPEKRPPRVLTAEHLDRRLDYEGLGGSTGRRRWGQVSYCSAKEPRNTQPRRRTCASMLR